MIEFNMLLAYKTGIKRKWPLEILLIADTQKTITFKT
jgi:hypothetical protein